MNAGAFADDIALIARTPRGLLHLLDDFAAEFRLSGWKLVRGWMESQPVCGSTLMARGRCGLSTRIPTCRFSGNRFLQLVSRKFSNTWVCLSL